MKLNVFLSLGWYVRDMKEKMAGPGDKYAKDTRKYNPDFAAEHPEDEYDNKIEEVNSKLEMGYKYLVQGTRCASPLL